MSPRFFLPIMLFGAIGASAYAQESGGLHLAPNVGRGPVGLAQPMPFVPSLITAQQAQNGMNQQSHQALNQNMITSLRGDPGFLSGFSFGAPLATSRQQVAAPATGDYGYGNDGGYGHRHHHKQTPVVINNTGPLAVTVGNGNVVQQQYARGSGPIAQQQVSTTAGSAGGGAANVVTGSGNILQTTP
jgi:hypothetical protein